MATLYVIWDRKNQSFIGGGQPVKFDQSADATTHANTLTNNSNHHVTQPKPVFDIITVTV